MPQPPVNSPLVIASGKKTFELRLFQPAEIRILVVVDQIISWSHAVRLNRSFSPPSMPTNEPAKLATDRQFSDRELPEEQMQKRSDLMFSDA